MKGEEDNIVFSKEPFDIVETQEEEAVQKDYRELSLEGDNHLMEEAQQQNVKDQLSISLF